MFPRWVYFPKNKNGGVHPAKFRYEYLKKGGLQVPQTGFAFQAGNLSHFHSGIPPSPDNELSEPGFRDSEPGLLSEPGLTFRTGISIFRSGIFQRPGNLPIIVDTEMYHSYPTPLYLTSNKHLSECTNQCRSLLLIRTETCISTPALSSIEQHSDLYTHNNSPNQHTIS